MEKNKNIWDKLYDFFASIKLAVVLLFLLAVTSIIGTVIEQQASPDVYDKYGPFWKSVILKLDLYDVYHSWWYILLIVLFAINLIVCSIKRLPYIYKLVQFPKKELTPDREKSLPLLFKITLDASKLKEIKERVVNLLKKYGYKVEVKEEGRNIYIFADKKPWARYGVYIVHTGILIILIGALISALFGYRGYMNLAPQTNSNLVTLFYSDKIIELPFYVKCNDFHIEFYPNGMPKAYVADISIIKDGKVVAHQKVKVNEPLEYDGIYFYQASYGQGAFLFKLNQNGKIKEIPVALQQAFKVLNTYYIPLGWDSQGRIFVQYIVHGLKKGFLMIQGIPYQVGPNTTLTCEGIFPDVMWTGLQVSKDPGANIVWLGSAIMIIGLIIAFFIAHHRAWVRLEKEKERENRILFVIGGITNKEKEKLEKELSNIFENIKKDFAASDIGG